MKPENKEQLNAVAAAMAKYELWIDGCLMALSASPEARKFANQNLVEYANTIRRVANSDDAEGAPDANADV